MSFFSLSILYAQCYLMASITNRWWVGAILAGLVTHLGLFVFARDNNGDLSRLWVIFVGTTIRVPWQINGPLRLYESEFTVNGEPTAEACEVRHFIAENFHSKDYVFTKNREIIFKRKRDAVMFKLAMGPFN